jgi:small-conductance mechanosensitive channel
MAAGRISELNIQLQNCQLFGTGLQSTREKLQRQEERDNQIAFLENQKSSLKNRECDSLEDIGRKLEMFHSYEDQIAAVKESYNNSQMYHIMDEAEESVRCICGKVSCITDN